MLFNLASVRVDAREDIEGEMRKGQNLSQSSMQAGGEQSSMQAEGEPSSMQAGGEQPSMQAGGEQPSMQAGDEPSNRENSKTSSPVGENLKKKKSVSTIERIHSEVVKLIFLPFVADKIFKDEKIYGDLSGLIRNFYPDATSSQVKSIESFSRFFVVWKRKYEYVVKRLEHQVKAASILPKNAPIVAQEGEYAPADVDLTKQTPSGHYQVTYKPYKYLEYDKGEFGEPVRRMDENYVSPYDANYDKLVLAILKFDIPGFMDALRKLPHSDDGSSEKFQPFVNDGEIRLLSDLSALGDEKNVKTVLDILVPKGFYVNGDVLNPSSKMGFQLLEHEIIDDNGRTVKPSENVAAYQIFMPLASNVVRDDRNYRVLTGRVRIPILFSRDDVSKPMRLSGIFHFQLCRAGGICQDVVSTHQLSLKTSENDSASVYSNFVTQAFMHLPKTQSKHANLVEALYNPHLKQLMLRFEASDNFSNFAAMVEDANGTDFINPKYQISKEGKWTGKVVFDVAHPSSVFVDKKTSSSQNLSSLSDVASSSYLNQKNSLGASEKALPEIAVSASFDNNETLRTVVIPHIVTDDTLVGNSSYFNWWLPLLFGILLNLFPALIVIYLKLLFLLTHKSQPLLIFTRFALIMMLAVGAMACFPEIVLSPLSFLNPCLLFVVAAILIAQIMEIAGYMNFALFRPLKKIFKFGMLIALFAVTLIIVLPIPYKLETFDALLYLPLEKRLYSACLICLGIFLPSLIALTKQLKWWVLIVAYSKFFLFYNVLAGLWLFYLVGIVYSWKVLLLLICFCGGLAFLWYIFPFAVSETIQYSRSAKKKNQLFQTVQKHALFLLSFWCCLFIGGAGLVKPFSYSYASNSSAETCETWKLPDFNNPSAAPLLLVVEAPYSLQSLSNASRVRYLEKQRLAVRHVNVLDCPRYALKLLQQYHKSYLPLTVLFTYRHPSGLVLPDNLDDVNFNMAIDGW